MTSEIPKEKEAHGPQKVSALYKLKWLSSLIFILSIIPLSYYKYSDRSSINRIITYFNLKEEPLYAYEYLDIANEEEYLKLGLTPQKPVKITPLNSNDLDGLKSRTYHGRFLHLTDIHPDEYYVEGSSIDGHCHGDKTSKNSDIASKYGDAVKGCDSPPILMDATLKWVKENLKDKIDFVIWTGDNIRHDSDRRYPRTEMKIFDMNRIVADKFEEVFHGDHDKMDPRDFQIPVIPSLGNNDVYPHNLFSPGPTLQTRELWAIWQHFVPENQLHVFQKGAYFFNEVIPGKLAVLSINTLYLFKSNPLTDSCDRKKDPGYELFKWLGITLAELRERDIKVWLSGHVPPIPKNFDISCYRKFAVWVHEYRDIIIGGVYGHMNIDHFIPSDSEKAYRSLIESYSSKGYVFDDDKYFSTFDIEEEEDQSVLDFTLKQQYENLGFDLEDFSIEGNKDMFTYGGPPNGKEAYLDSVRETFYADVKSKKNSGENAERYAITNVAASIIPTFNPGMRVWEYNITGLGEETAKIKERKPWDQFFQELEEKLLNEQDDEDDEDDEDLDFYGDDTDDEAEALRKGKKKKGKGKKKKSPKDDITLPHKKPSNLPLGPAYTSQLLSPVKFVQYYSDLESINDGKKEFGYEVEYKSTDEPLNMKGLLVDDYLKLARDLGKSLGVAETTENEEQDVVDQAKKKTKKTPPGRGTKLQVLWETYMSFAFVSSGYHDT